MLRNYLEILQSFDSCHFDTTRFFTYRYRNVKDSDFKVRSYVYGFLHAKVYNSKVQKASDRKLLRYVLSQNLSCKHTFKNTYNLDCYDAKILRYFNKRLYYGANIQDSDGKVLGTKVVAKCVNNSLRFDISENSSKHKWLFDSTLKNKCKNNFKSNTITHENPYVMAALEVDARSGRVVHRMLNGAPSNAFIFHDVPNLPSLGNCDKKAGVYNLGGEITVYHLVKNLKTSTK